MLGAWYVLGAGEKAVSKMVKIPDFKALTI